MIKPLPDLQVEDFAGPNDFILAFYKLLGWNPNKQELDARKIKVHPDVWAEICTEFRKKWGLGAGLAWMNYGPSGDESNSYNLKPEQVKLEKRAVCDLPATILC